VNICKEIFDDNGVVIIYKWMMRGNVHGVPLELVSNSFWVAFELEPLRKVEWERKVAQKQQFRQRSLFPTIHHTLNSQNNW